MNDDGEEYDEEAVEGEEFLSVPVWRWSWWEVAGTAIGATSGVLMALGGAANYLARECVAAANYQRQNAETREAAQEHALAQREIARGMREIFKLPEADR